MKALLQNFRLSRKLVIIVGGVALLMGLSGVGALYFGKDRVLGFVNMASTDGLQCTDVNLVTIRKQNHLWIRKYITTKPTDGVTRVKTALRVAKAIYDEQKPDLVQVVVLDKNGPTLRYDIRGRALGADVVYVPDPSKVGDGTVEAPFTARYYDGGASDQGLFYGERVDMLPKDIDGMMASIKDHTDCADPVAAEADKQGTPTKGKKKKAEAAEEKAAAKVDNPPEQATRPAEHPSPDHKDMKPDDSRTGSFVGASADDPASPSTEENADAARSTGSPPAGNIDAEAERVATDPQITGASRRRSPVTN